MLESQQQEVLNATHNLAYVIDDEVFGHSVYSTVFAMQPGSPRTPELSIEYVQTISEKIRTMISETPAENKSKRSRLEKLLRALGEGKLLVQRENLSDTEVLLASSLMENSQEIARAVKRG